MQDEAGRAKESRLGRCCNRRMLLALPNVAASALGPSNTLLSRICSCLVRHSCL